MTKPTVIDLFAGCGGMTVGFSAEGFQPLLAVEWDRFAAATYAANWGEDHVIPGDIADVLPSQIPNADLMIGGPPCQGFSNLGLKRLDDPRNQLWREYMRFIRTANPQVFVIENVDRFSKSPEFEMLQAEVDHGELSQYEISYGVLNAADYGVSQRRRRTIVIGSRVGKISLPEPTHARNPVEGVFRGGQCGIASMAFQSDRSPPNSPRRELSSSVNRCQASSRASTSTSGATRDRFRLSVTPTFRPGEDDSICQSTCCRGAGERSRQARPM